jgi:hypothetical protein
MHPAPWSLNVSTDIAYTDGTTNRRVMARALRK